MLLTKNTKRISIKEFGINADSEVTGLNDTFNPNIPTKKEYFFDVTALQDILAFMTMPDDSAYWLWGLHGTGKTSMIEQVCSRLNWPCYSITGSATMEIEDLLYQNRIQADGSTTVDLNALAKAFHFGGVFLFNEIDLVHPSKLTALNEILSGNTLIIPGIDETLHKHEAFRFIVTANTNGSFDEESGISFEGTESMNIAFMDRFIVNQYHYLPEVIELQILTGFSKQVYAAKNNIAGEELLIAVNKITPMINKMIGVAKESRKAANNSGDFNRPVSIRGLKRWVQKAIQFEKAQNPIKKGFEQSILNAYSASHQVAMLEFYNDAF